MRHGILFDFGFLTLQGVQELVLGLRLDTYMVQGEVGVMGAVFPPRSDLF